MEQQENKKEESIKTALIVEDDPIQQRILRHQLESLGYQVDSAADGLTAIQKVQEKTYDLIITDLRLPHRSGAEVLQAVRQSKFNRHTHLILASAQINKPDFKTYLVLGADSVLIKPYSREVLANTLRKLRT